MTDIRPVFLLSLPRSGSTLVQRIMATHPEVATATEPWILLPHLYAATDRGIHTEYHQSVAVRGLHDFVETVPGGWDSYHEDLRAFILRQYRRSAGEGAGIFLDKTPRYHLLADRLLRVFPEARIIVLWRNPLAVAASILETWSRGRWDLHRWRIDLYGGIENLCALAEAGDDRVLTMRYEDLVAGPDTSIDRLFRHLDLVAPPAAGEAFGGVRLGGRLGDRTGTEHYRSISTESLEKWPGTLANPLRRRWARGYLKWIGPERLALMGYSADALRRQLGDHPLSARFLLSDVVRRAKGTVAVAVDPHASKEKLRAARAGRHVYLNA